MTERWQFWIDRGGTFTDVVARRPDGDVVSHKLLSENPEQYADAALEASRPLLGVAAAATCGGGVRVRREPAPQHRPAPRIIRAGRSFLGGIWTI